MHIFTTGAIIEQPDTYNIGMTNGVLIRGPGNCFPW